MKGRENSYDSMACYDVQELLFDDCAFQTIETSYVITMALSERQSSFMRELQKHRPTRRTFVVTNTGFKSCSKEQWVKHTYDDLWHVNRFVFEHFQQIAGPHEKCVMILEDDVVFMPCFRENSPKVDMFMRKSLYADGYNLGCVPVFVNPVAQENYHHHLRIAACAHAMIYTRDACSKMLQNCNRGNCSVGLHDGFIHPKLKIYTFRQPLATQPFDVDTENMKEWIWGGKYTIRALQWYGECTDSNMFVVCHNQIRYGGLGGIGVILVVCILVLIITLTCIGTYLAKRAQHGSAL